MATARRPRRTTGCGFPLVPTFRRLRCLLDELSAAKAFLEIGGRAGVVSPARPERVAGRESLRLRCRGLRWPALVPVRRLLVGPADAQGHRLIARVADDLKGQRQPARGESVRYGEG